MKKVTNSIKAIFIITLMIKILGLVYKMILTRILKIAGMIVYSIIAPALSLSICLSSFNIQIVCNQNVSENNIKPIRSILKSAAKINIITSSIVSLIILLAFPFYKKIYGNILIYYPLLTIIPLIFFSNFSGIMKGYLEAKKDFTTPGISNLIEQIAKIGLSVLFLYFVKDKNIYTKVFYTFLAMSLSEISSFTYLIFKVKKQTRLNWFKTCDNQKINILKQATPLTLEHFVISITAFFEPILFFFFANLAGIDSHIATLMYTICNQYAIPLLIIAAFVSTTLGKTLFPYISESKRDLSKIKNRIDTALIITLAISILNFNICHFYTNYTLNFLYNDTSSEKVVKLLSYFYYFSYYSPIFVSILQASRSQNHLFIESIVLNLFSLLLTISLIFIKKIGIYSLPINIGTIIIIKNISNYYYIKKNLNYKISIRGFSLSIIVLIQNIIMSNLLKQNTLISFCLTNLTSLMIIAFYYYLFHKNKSQSHHMMHT